MVKRHVSFLYKNTYRTGYPWLLEIFLVFVETWKVLEIVLFGKKTLRIGVGSS